MAEIKTDPDIGSSQRTPSVYEPPRPVTALQERLTADLAGRYEVQREIGQGGMATVFLARDLAHDRDVAIKVLQPDLALAVGADRFKREIEIASRLQHPHILALWDSGQAAHSLYYVMPYLRGESLRDRMDREGQLGLDDAIALACEVASALGYAHAQGVVHRDIKPENILLEDGHAVVADFGIAHAVSAIGEQKLTQTGVTLGTPTYMSPEQAFAEKAVDGRSDIYSLACVLYEMLAGQPPFTGPNAQSIMARHTMEQVPSLTIVRQSVPEHVEEAVFRALAKTPADRFATAEEFIEALRTPGARNGPRRTQRLTAVERRRHRTRRIFYATGLPLLAAAAAASLYVYLRPASGDAMTADSSGAARKVAVLYFRDGDEGGKLTYLADALTESLIERLRQVQALTVVSRNGVAPFRDSDIPEDSIARVLQVGTIVDGTVDEERDGIRVRVRLVDGGSGDVIDRAAFSYPKDLLVVRDSLAGDVAAFLRTKLGEEVRLRERKASTRVVAAWSLMQQAERARKDAEALLHADSAAAAVARLSTADSLLAAAERADPKWAEPIAERSLLTFRRVQLDQADRSVARQWVDSGMALANRALAVDSTSAAASEARGTLHYARYVLQLDPDTRSQLAALDAAGADLRRAVRLDGTRARAWLYLSYVHGEKVQPEDVQLAAQRAYEADAYLEEASDVINQLFQVHYSLATFDEATKWCRIGATRFANDVRFTHCQLVLLATPANRNPDIDSAWTLYERMGAIMPKGEWEQDGGRNSSQIRVAAVIAYASRRDSTRGDVLADSARRVLERARADRDVDPALSLASDEAQVRAILGDRDEAVRLLKLYLTANPGHREGFGKSNAWMWRELRQDARFRELVDAT